jgi:hypothetical protein
MISSAAYDLEERSSYSLALILRVIPDLKPVIPAKAGIHCGRRLAPPTGLTDHVLQVFERG